MSTHTVPVTIEIDESDVACMASDEIATRVEKSAWYHEIRKGVDAMVLDEVREKVRERVALALDRGVSVEGSRMRGGFNLNAQTGAGEDWYPTEPLEDFIERRVRAEVASRIEFISRNVASKVEQEIPHQTTEGIHHD